MCYYSYYNKYISAKEAACSVARHNCHPCFTRLKKICENLSFWDVYGGLKVNLVHLVPVAVTETVIEGVGMGGEQREDKTKPWRERSLVWIEYTTNAQSLRLMDGTWHLWYRIQWRGRKNPPRSIPRPCQASGLFSVQVWFFFFCIFWCNGVLRPGLRSMPVHGERMKAWMMWIGFDNAQYVLSKYIYIFIY